MVKLKSAGRIQIKAAGLASSMMRKLALLLVTNDVLLIHAVAEFLCVSQASNEFIFENDEVYSLNKVIIECAYDLP